jgi:hypothetical protein
MTTFQDPSHRSVERFAPPTAAFRSPQRISTTVSYQLHQRLLERSNREGRSLSNLAAFLLEQCCFHGLDG